MVDSSDSPIRKQLPKFRYRASGPSGFYPFKGIYYFATHPFLYPLLKTRLLPCALISIFVLSTLFIWTYLPQVAFLSLFHGRLAWFNATILVLGEGAAIIALLFEAFLVDETLVDVFDAVLVNEGLETLVRTNRIVEEEWDQEDGGKWRNPVQRLRRPQSSAVYSPFNLRQIVEFIVLLPLNLVPGVGTPLFLILTGYRAGPLHHHRYFKLLGYDKKQKQEAVKKRQLRYTWFGMSALVLQLVPGLSMLFLLTTAAGSAIWVVRLERAKVGAIGIEAVPDEAPHAEYNDEVDSPDDPV